MPDTAITLEKHRGAYWLRVNNPGNEVLSRFTLQVGGSPVPFVSGAAEAPCLVIAAGSCRLWRTGIRAVDEARLPSGVSVSWVKGGVTYRRHLESPR